MKYLGIDFGTKRVGVAVSDEAGEFAFPKKIIAVDVAEKEILKLCKEEEVGAIVIGQSLATNEGENELQTKVNNFVNRLSEKTGLNVFFEKEGFSSFEAHRYQTTAGDRDDSAAAVILQRFLDKNLKK